MSCPSYTLNGIGYKCKDSLGGIKEVFIALAESIDEITFDTAGSKITAITLGTGASKFKTFKFKKATGYMNSNLQTSDNAGNSIQTELFMQFMKMETSKRTEMMALLMSPCVAIVHDSNDKYWFLGHDNPVEASAGTGATGTAATDLNGYTITMTDESKALPFEIDATAITDTIIDDAPAA